MFVKLITECANCPPFTPEAIVENAKGHILQPSQMIWTALDLTELTGKPASDPGKRGKSRDKYLHEIHT